MATILIYEPHEVLAQKLCDRDGGVNVSARSAAGKYDLHGNAPLLGIARDTARDIEHDTALGKLHDQRRAARGEEGQ